jgi:AraC family transcriptional regulator, regulatory protein of adaptative response / methylated-DNA-[protein]-cysteine methyltransferase
MNIPVTDVHQLSEDYLRIEQAILYLEKQAYTQPELRDVANAVGLSEYHFQRLFSRWAGISPKRFLQFITKESAKELLSRSENLLDTAYGVGLSSLGRLHDLFVTAEAVTPGEYKSGGEGLTVRFGLHETPFGRALIAVTERGICHLGFVESSEGVAIDTLVSNWPGASMVEDQRATAPLVRPIFDLGQSEQSKLRLHLRGTNFQLKVWEALLRIPLGAVSSYEGLAATAGYPGASRAVGTALARNPIAVLIPCHRVIRKLGEFGNYRYGVARKKALLGWEAANLFLHQQQDNVTTSLPGNKDISKTEALQANFNEPTGD